MSTFTECRPTCTAPAAGARSLHDVPQPTHSAEGMPSSSQSSEAGASGGVPQTTSHSGHSGGEGSTRKNKFCHFIIFCLHFQSCPVGHSVALLDLPGQLVSQPHSAGQPAQPHRLRRWWSRLWGRSSYRTQVQTASQLHLTGQPVPQPHPAGQCVSHPHPSPSYVSLYSVN